MVIMGFSQNIYSSWQGIQEQKFREIKRVLGPMASDMFHDKIVLDIGCGFGYLEKSFRAEFIGLDNNKAMLSKQATIFPRVLGDGDSLPFGAGSFDTVISIDTMHLLKTDDYTRVMKTGGFVLLSIFFNDQNYMEKKESLMKKAEKLEIVNEFEIHGKEKEYIIVAVKK